jgi:hypothetical protein
VARHLEDCTLSVFIDCSKSNLLNGARCFAGRSLHDIATSALNPYEQCMSAVLGALAPWSPQVRLFSFADALTGGTSTSPLSRSGDAVPPSEVLAQYRAGIKGVTLAGPTCFAPALRRAAAVYDKCVARKRGLHFCLILADSPANAFKETHAALVEASKLPLSVALVGVGDGPWEELRVFNKSVHLAPAAGAGSRKVNSCNCVVMEEVRARVAGGEGCGAGGGGEGGGATSVAPAFAAALAAAVMADVPRQVEDMLKKGILKK